MRLRCQEGQAGPPVQRKYEGGFAASLMLKVRDNFLTSVLPLKVTFKDMGLATGSGKMLNVPLPLGEKAEEVYAEMLKTKPELAVRDFSSVYRYLEELQGISRADDGNGV
jgi:3-hydroxyisobutyrate dehydrogenase